MEDNDSQLLSSNKFFDAISQDIDLGYRFTPFVGSGLSSRSGIMMGQDFANYLAYVVMRCVLTNEEQLKRFGALNPKKYYQRISLLDDGWPDKPLPQETAIVEDWVEYNYNRLLKKHTPTKSDDATDVSIVSFSNLEFINTLYIPLCPQILFIKKDHITHDRDNYIKKLFRVLNNRTAVFELPRTDGILADSKEAAIESGIRALHDWRGTLNYLARLNFDRGSYYYDDTPNQTIIDSFNEQLVWDKKPSLAHFVIAHLMRPLRIRTILTTNFDTLIEQAIRNVKIPINVLDARLNGTLPDPDLVHLENTVIKLHGSSIDTRSDFSLDEAPNREERHKFERYLYKPEEDIHRNIPSHLLVMGFSGRDHRVIQFFRHLLERNSLFKLYWIVYSDSEVKYLKSIFSDEKYLKNVFFVVETRQDLFLYELYQKLTLSLPPGGLSYELGQYVPPDYRNEEASVNHVNITNEKQPFFDSNQIEKLFNLVTSKNNPPKPPPSGISVDRGDAPTNATSGLLLTVDAVSGVAAPMLSLFRDFKKQGFFTIWFELEDFVSPHGLASKILQVLSHENGVGRHEHFGIDVEKNSSFKDFQICLKNYLDIMNITPENWVFFLYGRNGPGGCSGWENKYWDKDDYKKLDELLQTLKNLGFKLLYMPFSKDRFTRNEEKEEFVEKAIKDHSSYYENYKDKIPHEVYSDIQHFFDIAGQTTKASLPLANYNQSSFYKWILPNSVIDEDASAKGGDVSNESNFEKIFEKITSLKFFEERAINCKPEEQRVEVSPSIIHFLYSSTLFRQSRHPSALISEAVYPCPEKFNKDGKDNDFIRSENVNNWITKLERSIFFRKPGGYVWKYRDIRLGIKHFLETTYYPDIVKNSSKSKTDFLFQRRARTHFWIGEWYLRSFHSIKHTAPLIEAIYHRICTVNFTRFAKPSELSFKFRNDEDEGSKSAGDNGAIYFYRLHLLQSTIIEIIKTLRIASPVVAYWGQRQQTEELFTFEKVFHALGLQEVTNNLLDSNATPEETASKNAKAIYLWIQEKVGIDSKNAKHLQLAEAYMLIQPTSESIAEAQSDATQGDTYFGSKGIYHLNMVQLITSLEHEINEININLLIKSGKQNEKLFLHQKYYSPIHVPQGSLIGFKFPALKAYLVPYRPWNKTIEEFSEAVMFILRSGNKHKIWTPESTKLTQFIELTSVSCNFEAIDEIEAKSINREISEIKQLWVIMLAGKYEAIVALSSILNEYAYALLRKAKLVNRLTDDQINELSPKINYPTKNNTSELNLREEWKKQLWVSVCSICWIGQDLLKNVHPDYFRHESPLKLKFLTFYGLALANLGRFYEAQRRFNEASAYMNYASDYEENLNLAILRMRRSEAHILGATKVVEVHEYISSQLTDSLDKESRLCKLYNFDSDSKLPFWINSYKDLTWPAAQEAFRRLYVAKLDDASFSVAAAESLLAGYDKSSHWWGHLNLLKLIISKHSTQSHSFKSFFYQRKIEIANRIEMFFKKGMLVSHHDPFRKLRLIDEFYNAMMSSNSEKSSDKFKIVFFEMFPELHNTNELSFRRKLSNKLGLIIELEAAVKVRRKTNKGNKSNNNDRTDNELLMANDEVKMYFESTVDKLINEIYGHKG